MALVFIVIVVSGMGGFVLGALAVSESYKHHKDKGELKMTDLEYIKNDDLAELKKAIEHCSSLSMQNEKYYKQTMEQGDVVGMQYFVNLYGEYNQIYQWLTELKERRAADAQPVKRGHWYHNTSRYVSELDAYFIQACCSCCNRYSDRIDQYSQIMSNETCSHCGADMRGDAELREGA